MVLLFVFGILCDMILNTQNRYIRLEQAEFDTRFVLRVYFRVMRSLHMVVLVFSVFT